MTQNGKLMPNLDKQSTKVLNLTVLQRIDPFVEEILIAAAHVTFYEFNIDLNHWSRKDVEGSLFVVKRTTQPRFQFIVMNRRNTDSLVEDILGDFEYEVQVPYLLYRNAAQEVNGIWFYNSQDCEAVANLFSRILCAFSKVPPKPKASSTKSNEFEELEAVPSLAVIEGPLEPTTSSAASASDADDSFINYFSAATNFGNASNTVIASNTVVAGQPLQSSLNTHLSSHAHNAVSSAVLPLQPAPTLPTPFAHTMPMLDTQESTSSITHYPNLMKPPLFAPPSSSSLVMPHMVSSMPTAPPVQLPASVQRLYGSPLLQPFPPPTPSSSLAPTTNIGSVITRDRVCDALLRLVQNNQFIDLVYQELTNDLSP